MTGIFTGTLGADLADTLLLPYTVLLDSSTRRIDAFNQTTILEWVKRNNIYTLTTGQELTIRGVFGDLDTAGACSTKRMVAYRRSPEVLKFHMPMPFRFLPAWQTGPIKFEVPGIFRLGSVEIRRPRLSAISTASRRDREGHQHTAGAARYQRHWRRGPGRAGSDGDVEGSETELKVAEATRWFDFEGKAKTVAKVKAVAKVDDTSPKTAAEVLAMVDGNFMAFKSAASKLLGDKTPSKKDEIVTALEELATQP